MRSSRIGRIFAILILGSFFVWQLLTVTTENHVLAAEDSASLQTIEDEQSTPPVTSFEEPASTEHQIQPTEQITEPLLVGFPCGNGAQLPDWIICLHGTVNGVDGPLDGVVISATRDGKTVSGETYIHPGEDEPTYGIEISRLDPIFLEPVTLTASYNGINVSFNVPVFPDFNTRNQRFDFPLKATTPSLGNRQALVTPTAELPGELFGFVIDFASGGTITEGLVLLVNGDQITSTQTLTNPDYSAAYYSFSAEQLAAISVTEGTTVTLIASYNGDDDSSGELVIDQFPNQHDFLVGWNCDEFSVLREPGSDNGLPGTTGVDGLPGTTGVDGLPDLGCFWGYVDGTNGPEVGVDVELEVNGITYLGRTQNYRGEDRPRFGLTVRRIDELDGKPFTLTTAFEGAAGVFTGTVGFDDAHSQQSNIQLDILRRSSTFDGDQAINSFISHDGFIWAGTPNGLRKFTIDGENGLVQGKNGPRNNKVSNVTLDSQNNIWLISQRVVYKYDPANQSWQTFDQDQVGQNVTDIVVGQDESVWFISNPEFSNKPISISILIVGNSSNKDFWRKVFLPKSIKNMDRLVVDKYGGLWFSVKSSTECHVNFYNSVTQKVEERSYANVFKDPDLECGGVRSLAIDKENNLWVGMHRNGVVRTKIDLINWNQIDLNGDSISDDAVPHISVDENNAIWFFSGSMLSKYEESWEEVVVLARFFPETLQAIHGSHLWFYSGFGNKKFDVYSLTDGSLITQLSAKNVDNSEKHAIAFSQDRLWLGGSNGLGFLDILANQFVTVAIPSGLISGTNQTILQLSTDPTDSTIWATTSLGLAHYIDTDTVEYFLSDSFNYSEEIFDLDIHPDRTVWIASNNGIFSFSPNEVPSWKAYTETHGLQSANIQSIVIDFDGSVWALSLPNINNQQEGGVSRYDKNSDSWIPFEISSSLGPGSIINWLGTYESDQGIIIVKDQDIYKVIDSNLIAIGKLPISLNSYSFRNFSLYFDKNSEAWLTVLSGGNGIDDNHSITYYKAIDASLKKWKFLSSTPCGDYNGANGSELLVGDPDQTWLFNSCNGNNIERWFNPEKVSDLSIDLKGPNELNPNSIVTYTAVISNKGGATALGSSIQINLPAGINFALSSTAPQSLSPLKWALPDIMIGENYTLTITGNVIALPNSILEVNAKLGNLNEEDPNFNNEAYFSTTIIDPRPDVRSNIIAPPLLLKGESSVFNIQVDNTGGSNAENTVLIIELSPDLSLDINYPFTGSVDGKQLTINLDSLAAKEKIAIPLRLIMGNNPQNTRPDVSLAISTASEERNSENNTARADAPLSLDDRETLILVAPHQMNRVFGAAPELEKAYLVAGHDRVKGIVVNVEEDQTVKAAYTAWNNDYSSTNAANKVAEAIHTYIHTHYTDRYPKLKYIVIVGGDNIVPFYRVKDRSLTTWRESNYGIDTVPQNTTIYHALLDEQLLTDDFYADRVSTIVQSQYWPTDNGPLHLPDFAIGRLVETPQEIAAAIDTFLNNNGQISLNPAIVGSTIGNDEDGPLTADLDQAICTLLEKSGLPSLCKQGKLALRNGVADPSQAFNLIAAAQHSSHYGAGLLRSEDILNYSPGFSGVLMTTIGCHAGLSVPQRDATSMQVDYDMAQSFLNRGGTMVGSTSFAYGSKLGVGFSEELLLELLRQLVNHPDGQIGPALVRAKQQYAAKYSGTNAVDSGLDHIDQKVLLPFTLYGFPMVEVSIAGRRASQIVGPQPYPSADLGQIENVIVRPINRENLEFSPNQLGDSTYYDYKGQYLEKEGRPVQPLERITLTPLDNGFVAKGTILLSASYRDELNFKPLFGQPWALSSLNTAVSQINPNDLLGGWDHQRPYLISPHNSQLQSEGKLSLIYGAYHAETGIERLFENMSLEVIYADPNNQDLIPPVIDQTSSFIYAGTGPVKLSVRPIDESDIVRSVGVCDDGNGSWTTTELSKAGNSWVGECSSNSVRSYVHVIDAAGNVAVTEWQSPVNLVDSIYLPAITNRLYNLPDLTIQSVVNTTSNVEIVIKNQGTHGVTFEDRFYVDLYFDPDPAPLGVNETWDDGRSKHGAIWRISTNLAPGDTLTLSKDDAYYWQEGSNWPDTISDSVEIYAQVDSANYGTASGAVLELDEVNDAPYNNVFGPTRAKSHDYYLWEERKKGFIYPSQWLEWTYSEWPRRSED